MPITQINISLNDDDEFQLRKNDFKKNKVNLNQGAGGNKIHLWYKDEDGGQPITRIQFSYTDDMAKGLDKTGFTKVNKNLNAGAGGACIYLWFFRGSTEADVPINDLYISLNAAEEAKRVELGWERLTCDLNQGAAGRWIYLWLERMTPMYISEVEATNDLTHDVDLLKKGFTRMDDNTNKFVTKDQVYIWYLLTPDEQKAIRNLKISVGDDQYNHIQQQGLTPVNMDLNKGTGRDQMFLWYREEGNYPIKGMGIITDRAVEDYKKARATVLKMTQTTSCSGSVTFHLCYYG